MAQPIVIVLAAGLGKRMGGELPKVLHTLGGRSLIEHVLSRAVTLSPAKMVVITGYKRELVERQVLVGAGDGSYCRELIHFAWQREQNGTGGAVRAALPELEGEKGEAFILSGDVPLISPASLRKLHDYHTLKRATLSFLTFNGDSSEHYGRVLRDTNGTPYAIREFRDCSPEEQSICEMNGGVYIVSSSFLRSAVQNLSRNNSQNEYYLTDLVSYAAQKRETVSALIVDDASELRGVNTPEELAKLERSFFPGNH